MTWLDLPPGSDAWITIGVLAVMLALFVREIYPTEVVALIGVSTLLVTGVLSYDDAVMALANPAPWTIAAMFIVMGALVRTGALDVLTRGARRGVARGRTRQPHARHHARATGHPRRQRGHRAVSRLPQVRRAQLFIRPLRRTLHV